MDSDFSVRNELDSVVRGPASDSDKYKVENPFSKLVDAFNAKEPSPGTPTSNVNHEADSWRNQAFFASSVAQQQADVAHRAIDLMHKSLLGETNKVNYWKYVAIASLGVIAVIMLIYWKSSVKLRLYPEKEIPER